MSLYSQKILAIRFWSDILIVFLCFTATLLFLGAHIGLLESGFFLFLVTGWYISTRSNDLYDEFRYTEGFTYEILTALNTIFVQAALAGLFLFTIKHPLLGRSFVVMYTALLLLFIPLEKIVLKNFMVFLRRKGKNIRNVIVVGASKLSIEYYELLKRYPSFGYKVIGFVDDAPQSALNGRYLGNIAKLNEIFIGKQDINELIIALPNSETHRINQALTLANNHGVRVRIIPDYSHFYTASSGIEVFGGIPMITLRHEPLEEYHWRVVKRWFDITFSFIVLVTICWWLFPIVALVIKLDSPGPVFFSQKRSGKDKREFCCHKFRSMVQNGDADMVQATRDDRRVTRVGRFLRKTNVDELPQFWNVFLGNMSVVGPRPHMLKHTLEYSEITEQYMVRHFIKPGITGWAQINGYRGEIRNHNDMQKRVEYDIWYLENWSLFLDIKVIFATLWNVLKGEENAY